MPSFLSELRRRNVLRVAAAYALVAWIIIEAGSVLLPTFGASDTTFQVYVLVVLLGFLVSLVFAWIFEITPEGVKLDKEVDRDSQAETRRKGITNFAIIGLLVVALGVSITFNVSDIRNAEEESAADIMASRRSIAVLPFSSRSADPDNSLFADGVHDDLLTKIANLGSLRVISRTSVMEYRDTTKNLRQIGRELDVDTLLEGTVQRIGDNVRINVQLIDAETDEHLWARIYDRQLTDDNLFAVQSDVSGEIAAALHSTLMPNEQLIVADVPTKSLRAYSLYSSGRDNLYLRQRELTLKSRQQFEEAITLDPEYAEAYAALAECMLLLSINHQTIPLDEAIETAGGLIDEALELDPDLADAYAVLGLLKTTEWSQTRIGTDNIEAETAFEQALALNPNHARTYMWFGNLRDAEQRMDEAIGFYHRSIQLDPLGRVPYNNLPTLYAQRGENEFAIKLWLDAIAIHPDWASPYTLISAHLATLGRLDEAFAWDRLASQFDTAVTMSGPVTFGMYLQFGDTEAALAYLDNLSGDGLFAQLAPASRLMVDGDYRAATDLLVEMAATRPELTPFIYGSISDVALLAGDLEVARDYILKLNPVLALDSSVQIDRFTIRDVIKLGFILRQEGDLEGSAEILRNALIFVQSMPRLGLFGKGVRDAQIYALLGQTNDAFAALDEAVNAGFRTSFVFDGMWMLQDDPYFSSIRDDDRFIAILNKIDALNSVMHQRVLEAQASGDWKQLTDLAGTI
jgi:TolB-like protein/Tfp pilus assembly protein PilF